MTEQTSYMIEQKKKLPLSSDIVFKRVFAKKGNEPILKALLEAILDTKIKSVVVQNPELPRDLYDNKAGILDIKVEIDNNTICDVEMQIKNENDIDKRSTLYMSKLVVDSLKVGEKYKNIKKIIIINILNFNYYKRNSYLNTAHMNFEESKPETYVDMGYKIEERIATQDIEMHFIELPKFLKRNPQTMTKLEQWLWLITGREDKIDMAKKENKEVKQATEIINMMSMNPEEWDMYFSRKMAIMDYNSGISNAREKGIEEGKKEEKIKIAKQLLKMGMNKKEIKKITELTQEEIEEIEKSK